MVLLGCLGRFVKVTRVCGIERGIPNPKKRGLRDCGPSRVASAAFEMMREWPRTRAQESIYGGDTKRGGLDPILNKAMRASYFYFCVSMLRSENPRGGSKALARAEGSVGAPQSSSRPSGMDSSLSAMHVLLLLRIRACWQILPPPHSLHSFFSDCAPLLMHHQNCLNCHEQGSSLQSNLPLCLAT